MESARINTNPTTGQFLEEAPLATEAEGLWGNVSTRLEYLNTAIVLFLHNKLCWAPLGSDMNSPFQTQPQTLEGIPISALNLRGKAAAGRFKQPPFFWMRELTKLCGPSEFKITSPDFWKIGFAWGFIHSFIYLFVAGGKGSCQKPWPWLQVYKHQEQKTCNRYKYLLQSVRHDDTLPSQPSLLWATAVESPLMTSRKKSAGLLWVSQVYPIKWKLLLYTSCADYGGVTKMSCSYQCLRSMPKLSVLDRDKPEHFKIKNDNVTFFSKYLLSRWKTTWLIPKSEKSILNN